MVNMACSRNFDLIVCRDDVADLASNNNNYYLYVPDEGRLLPKYRDCTTYNDFELYLMCLGVMLLLLIIYIYIYIHIYI